MNQIMKSDDSVKYLPIIQQHSRLSDYNSPDREVEVISQISSISQKEEAPK